MEQEIVIYDGTTPKQLESVWGKTVEMAGLTGGTLIVVFDTCVMQVERLLGEGIIPLEIKLGAFRPGYNITTMKADPRLNLIHQLEGQPFLGLDEAILVFGDRGILFTEDKIELLLRKSD